MMGTGKQLHNSVVEGPYFCYFRAGGGGGDKYVKFILIILHWDFIILA